LKQVYLIGYYNKNDRAYPCIGNK